MNFYRKVFLKRGLLSTVVSMRKTLDSEMLSNSSHHVVYKCFFSEKQRIIIKLGF